MCVCVCVCVYIDYRYTYNVFFLKFYSVSSQKDKQAYINLIVLEFIFIFNELMLNVCIIVYMYKN